MLSQNREHVPASQCMGFQISIASRCSECVCTDSSRTMYDHNPSYITWQTFVNACHVSGRDDVDMMSAI